MGLFDFLSKKEKKKDYHFLMDKDSNYLARGTAQKEEDSENFLFKVIDGNVERILKQEIVQLVPADDNESVTVGKAIARRANGVVIEPLRDAGMSIRKNFRMPVDFESFIYPDGGGRYIIKSVDLSCGGIAFYTVANLPVNSQTEVVIPITAEEPLIVRCEILRIIPFAPPIQKYACQFLDLIPDEEALIREAVFSVQLAHIRAGGARR